MNTELWHKVKQHILEEPNRLTMHIEIMCNKKGSHFNLYNGKTYDLLDGYSMDYEQEVELDPPCGTAACIAGWVVILGHPELSLEEIWGFNVEIEAERLLGVSSSDLDIIYYTKYWDVDLRQAFQTTDLQKRAEVAAEMMDRFEQRMRKPVGV